MSISKFALYAAEGSNRTLIGKSVKFVKGEYQMGPNKDLISPDKRFVAVMDTLTVGHIKWVDGKQVDHRVGLVADGYHPVHRAELDDFDNRENWETDEYGVRKDPWQPTTLLVLASPAAPHDFYTFTTTSEGGKSAIRDLCEAHARTTEAVGQYPVVTPGSDSYQHSNRAYGNIKVPVFEVVGCVDAGPFNALVAEARGGAGFIPAAASALLTSGMGRSPSPAAVTHGTTMARRRSTTSRTVRASWTNRSPSEGQRMG
ncbi:MAG TPA: hypothetical protein VFE60_07040 [Roseiarcus sp.]|jgi:hypothetical protein|nr:hypothetical protein [Roseiarcus sp.]